MTPGDVVVQRVTGRRGMVLRMGGTRVTVAFEDGTQTSLRYESVRTTGERRALPERPAGLCQRCSAPAEPGRGQCEPCLARQRLQTKLRRMRLLGEGGG